MFEIKKRTSPYLLMAGNIKEFVDMFQTPLATHLSKLQPLNILPIDQPRSEDPKSLCSFIHQICIECLLLQAQRFWETGMKNRNIQMANHNFVESKVNDEMLK